MQYSYEESKGLDLLKQIYPDTIHHYISDKYPFECDYYVPSLDMYIEGHYGWCHGPKQCHEPFDSFDEKHIKALNDLQEKAKTSNYYQNAIYQWTDLDVRKRQCAIDNKLNWKAFYYLEELEKWLKVFNIKEISKC